ncbi:Cytochrome P450 [Pseudooceanicola nitratireducens]|jgi:cytochrome P450|uniref:Cytochrome P450 n=1 Tax=Pseudooceanicola nitratireducens TaxID=517719 RepID=A0A1I1JC47_9RHOB|nr:cytochrome P450 [Pseudooceanicola nitratireducens]SEJ30963.1 Cytochrome P450 [Pseudooceanicola nitratireducens]SFC45955.1 Cytochrome P450 [Pseudooceanicola nitratireducens]
MSGQPTPDAPVSPLPVHAALATQPLGFFGSLRAARSNLLEILPELAVKQPMVSGKTGVRWHMVMDPTALRRILLEKVEEYPKSVVTKNLLRPAIGESLFVAEGAHWRWQRRAAAPAFSARNIGALAPVMTAAAEASADRIATAGPRAVNVYDEMVRATFEVISDVTLSGERHFDRAAMHRAIDNYIDVAGRVSLFDIAGMPGWVPRPGRVFSGNALKKMKSVADEAIGQRRQAKQPPDLLDLLIAGTDPETQRQMRGPEIRDNLLTFIVAGHETTALTLSWALYLLSFAPEQQERAAEEARSQLGDRAATADDVASMPFIRAVVDEALRLYPPAGIISRTAQQADTLCGREVRPGDTVMVPIYALHRNRLLWDNPDAFDPDRFMGGAPVDRYAYLPFGDGPRICIGAGFALQEAVIILATLLARFRFEAVAGKTPKPVLIITTRPEGGVWLTAHPRP